MGKIYFIRHNKIKKEYQKLGYKEINGLVSLRRSPQIIDGMKTNKIIELIMNDGSKFDCIMTSNQRRTYKTAEMLGFTRYNKTDKLNMKFTLDEIGIRDGNSENIIDCVRDKVFDYLLSDDGKNKRIKLYKNIYDVLMKCSNHSLGLVVSHGFLLKFIYCLLVLGKDMHTIKKEDFNSISFDYLDGFIVSTDSIRRIINI